MNKAIGKNKISALASRYPYEFVLFTILIVWMIFMAFVNENFMTFGNFITVITRMCEDGVVAAGMTLVIILGGMDLSVGAVMALVATSAGLMYGSGMAFPLAVLIGCSFALIVGLLNAFLVVNMKIQAMIATLGTMTAVRSIVYGITNGRPVATFPDGFGEFATATFVGIPVSVYILVAVYALVTFILSRTKIGRFIFAVGGNEKAARVSGINSRLIKRSVYILCAMLSALGGMMFASRMISASPDIGLNTAFDVLTAVLLGGTSILGGQGSVIRTLLGVFLMNLVINGLNMLGVDSYWQTIFIGVVLIAVVGFDERRKAGAITKRHAPASPKTAE